METEIEINDVLKIMREQLGTLMQENAVLKATIAKLQGMTETTPQP